jgi:hypothetical protein
MTYLELRRFASRGFKRLGRSYWKRYLQRWIKAVPAASQEKENE